MAAITNVALATKVDHPQIEKGRHRKEKVASWFKETAAVLENCILTLPENSHVPLNT